jgi:MoxR-like ATPase
MSWELFTGSGTPRREDPEAEAWQRIPPLPSWRRAAGRDPTAAPMFVMPHGLADAVNAALHLRRPLLLSGGPGSGKSTVADLIAAELELGTVLRWHITSKSTLAEGLYDYDALGRLHAIQAPARLAEPTGPQRARDDSAHLVQDFVTLGPLGTALAAGKPRAVLIDEIDKSDLDLPGDLLNVMENGEFIIPVLARANSTRPFTVSCADSSHAEVDADGVVRLRHFPVIVFTSNGERAFSPPFLRRCIRFEMPQADRDQLARIVAAHLGDAAASIEGQAIAEFAERLRTSSHLALNQILEFVSLVTGESPPGSESRAHLAEILLQELNGT